MQAEQQSERERFEAWAVSELAELDISTIRNEHIDATAYVKTETFKAWQAWIARAALSHPSTPQGWRDIESAPKDGRNLLLGYFNSHGKWRTLRGQWFSEESIEDTWEEPEFAGEGWYETPVEIDDTPNCFWTEPTHWMPLPPPPEQGGPND